MSTLTSQEVTGVTSDGSKEFFDKLENNPNKGHDWAIRRLCDIQYRQGKIGAGISGFQWKPYMSSFNHEYAMQGLKHIGANRDPSIRIVYLTRNPLDRRVSNIRHDISEQNGAELAAHCPIGDEECAKTFAQFEENDIILPTGKELLNWLKSNAGEIHVVKERLAEMGVDYVEVSYEKLYDAVDAEEWMRIFRFLGKGPAENLTMEEVRSSFSMASTHGKGREEVITNFEDVRDTLVGTQFEYLLTQ